MYDVVCIGSATRDVFLKSEGFDIVNNKLCLNLGSKVEMNDIFFATGGGATNAAATFSNQGLKTAAIFNVGDDPGGEVILNEMKKRFKVDVSFVQKSKDKYTGYSVILRCGEGRSGDRIILVYRGASENLEIEKISFKKIFKTRWVYLAPLGGENAKLFEPLVKEAVKNKVKIAVDLSKDQIKMGLEKLRPILNNVDVLKINREEGAYLTTIDIQDIFGIIKKLADVLKWITIITDGPNGVIVCDKKYLYQAGIYKEEKFVERTGAGDAFGAGFVSSLILDEKAKKPFDVQKAIRFGSANATAVVEALGAKNGLLKKGDFEKPRWEKLEIKIIQTVTKII